MRLCTTAMVVLVEATRTVLGSIVSPGIYSVRRSERPCGRAVDREGSFPNPAYFAALRKRFA